MVLRLLVYLQIICWESCSFAEEVCLFKAQAWLCCIFHLASQFVYICLFTHLFGLLFTLPRGHALHCPFTVCATLGDFQRLVHFNSVSGTLVQSGGREAKLQVFTSDGLSSGGPLPNSIRPQWSAWQRSCLSPSQDSLKTLTAVPARQ